MPAACRMPRLRGKSAPEPPCGGSKSLGSHRSGVRSRPRRTSAGARRKVSTPSDLAADVDRAAIPDFLAMQGPTKTTFRSRPWSRRRHRAVAIIGETIGASMAHELRMVALDVGDDRRAGRGDVSARRRSSPAVCGRRRPPGPRRAATSATLPKPSRRSMPTSRSGLMSVNSAGKLGARQTAVGAPESSSARTSSIVADHLFRALAADPHAVAAVDAALADDLRLAVRDADRLRRTFAHAGVAHPAAVGDGGDERRAHARSL